MILYTLRRMTGDIPQYFDGDGFSATSPAFAKWYTEKPDPATVTLIWGGPVKVEEWDFPFSHSKFRRFL
jgi:hypothetical protein